MNADSFIPFHRPSIDQSEIEAVTETLRSGWLTTGPRTAQFEREFREYTGAPYALAVNSCTAALHLALAALEIGPGDEVITTPLTFCATVNSISTGARRCWRTWRREHRSGLPARQSHSGPRPCCRCTMAGCRAIWRSIWRIARDHGLA